MRKTLACIASLTLSSSIGSAQHDIAILHGRVVDPETGLDAIRSIGITKDRITAVTTETIEADRLIDATGLIVSPGFIDAAADGFTVEGSLYKVTDGVTTQLGMESGPLHVQEMIRELVATGVYTNVGAATGHWAAREAAGVIERDRAATEDEISTMNQLIVEEIKSGALGIGFGIQYTPGASHDELAAMFDTAAHWGVPCHVHVRWLGSREPTSGLRGLEECLSLAVASGADLEIMHINSMLHTDISRALRLIDGAARSGLRVAANAYPYTAGSTMLESSVFDPGWQERMNCSYEDIQLFSGQRLDESSFLHHRNDEIPTPIIIHFIDRSVVDAAVRNPRCSVGSDGGIRNGRGHPRGAGSFAKFLREYVVDGPLTWLEGLEKITLAPARKLEHVSSDLAERGRLQVGAIADLTLIDPTRIDSRASFESPAVFSEGISHVIVNGAVTVSDNVVQDEVTAGRGILSDHSRHSQDGFLPFERRLAEAWDEYDQPGLAIVTFDSSGIQHETYLGFADHRRGTLLGPASRMQIGSVTKVLTAHLLQQHADAGLLSWGEAVGGLIPELRGEGGANPLTLEDLAAMRTGYPRTTSLWWDGTMGRCELVRELAATQDPSPSRDVFSYQNVGYAALGLAVERLAGVPWEHQIRSLFFGGDHLPLAFDLEESGPNSARPHSGRGSEKRVIPHRVLTSVGPAGSVVTTPRGIAKVMQRMSFGNENLDALVEQARARVVVQAPSEFNLDLWFPDVEELTYGLGLFRVLRHGDEAYNHAGGIDGMSADFWLLPNHGTGFVVLSNSGWNTSFFVRAVSLELLDELTRVDTGNWFEHYLNL